MTTQSTAGSSQPLSPTVVPPGADLAMAVAGAGEPVLFISGLGLAGCAWRAQVQALRHHVRCIWFDNRGTGRSAAPTDGVTICSLAEDARRILDAAGVGSAHVVGHSMGGVVAQELALVHPDRVRSLALLCTFSRGLDALLPRRGVAMRGLFALVGTPSSRARAATRLLASRDDIDRLGADTVARHLAEAFGRPVAMRPPVAWQQLMALAVHRSAGDRAALAAVPTLVISGTDDPLAPPGDGRRLARRVGARQYLEFAGASHALPFLQPDAVNVAILEHLRSV